MKRVLIVVGLVMGLVLIIGCDPTSDNSEEVSYTAGGDIIITTQNGDGTQTVSVCTNSVTDGNQ